MVSLFEYFVRRVIRKGRLSVALDGGRSFTAGDGVGADVAIRLFDRTAEWALLAHPELALGELYIEGRLQITKGRIYDLLELVAANIGRGLPPALGALRAGIAKRLASLKPRNSALRSKENVAHHYDLDGGLYDLFLDRSRQYSCAYFERPDQTLEDAQAAKMRHIAAKLLIEPGQTVLDIGCGWGGFASYLANRYDARVTGITLSERQLTSARQLSLGDRSGRCQFELRDYRGVGGTFDRIVSVGMFEHVGVPDYDAFFSAAANRLNEGGIMLLHTIGRSDGPHVSNPWIEKYIFPGGYVPALSEVAPAIERSGLIVTDIEILRLHYAETLKHWRERFAARRLDAERLYDERFCRIWEYYLAGCEVSFRFGGLVVFQFQLAKSLDTVPLTRDYITARRAQGNIAPKAAAATTISHREVVSRQLNEFQRRGWVEATRGNIEIVDRKALEALVRTS